MAEAESITEAPSAPSPEELEAQARNMGASDAAKFVMLGVIFLVLGAIFALILRLRYLSKNPQRNAADLKELSKGASDPSEDKFRFD